MKIKRVLVLLIIGLVILSGILYYHYQRYINEINILQIMSDTRKNKNPLQDNLGEVGNRIVLGGIDGARQIEYWYFIPSELLKNRGPVPVVVFMPGLGGSGVPYVSGIWAKFASENGLVIISPSFYYDENEWKQKRSYQFPEVWSGKTFIDMLIDFHKYRPIIMNGLFLFGFSAGAQFVHRFALYKPYMCVAVGSHAAGGYSMPTEYIPVKFMITIGENDYERMDKTILFYEICKKLNIDVVFKKYSNLGHEIKEEQIEKMLDFLAEKKKESNL